jgi:excinuclease UvrABC nuclease subunit
MPFENHGNRPFTAMVVDKNAPAASGVYGLSNARQWIYVGETANIQAELRNHLHHPSQLLRDHIASGYTFELSPAEYRIERQNQLVRELHPVGNRPRG